MNHFSLPVSIVIAAVASCSFCIAKPKNSKKPATWVDTELAQKEYVDFVHVGEYVNADHGDGIQVNTHTKGLFVVRSLPGGLPGEGWTGEGSSTEVLGEKELVEKLVDFRKVERESVTMGKAAPEGAVTLDGGFTNVKEGLLHAGGKSKSEFASFVMHLEFRVPFKPTKLLSHQDRGNSGIYIFNNYEIQVMDSFGLDYRDREANPFPLVSLSEQWCGCLYKMKMAELNMSLPPLSWQTYDIDFEAPLFEAGKKVKNARLTVHHNGVVIHDDVELVTGTGNGAKREQLAKGPIFFQSHGNPAVYRNVWVKAK